MKNLPGDSIPADKEIDEITVIRLRRPGFGTLIEGAVLHITKLAPCAREKTRLALRHGAPKGLCNG